MSWVRSPPCQLETLDLLFQSTPQKGYERAFTTGGRGSPTCTLPRENYSAVCPVGRGCGLENRLDVKVSGVQLPNTAFIWLYGIKVITPDCLSENLGSIPNRVVMVHCRNGSGVVC